MRAEEIEACAGYFLGLPEQPIGCVEVRDCDFSVTRRACPPMRAVMSDACGEVLKKGLIIRFARKVLLENVRFNGVEGEEILCEETEKLERRTAE